MVLGTGRGRKWQERVENPIKGQIIEGLVC